MTKRYYNIPLRFSDLLSRKPRDQYCCSLEESITQNISLIIGTKLQESRADLNYGCKVWDMDFVVPSNMHIWKEEIETMLEKAILTYETRIERVEQFKITVEEKHRRNHQILHFEIYGSIKGTHKSFEFLDTLFFSPYTR